MLDKSQIREGLRQNSSRISWREIKVDILSEVIFLVSRDLVLLEVVEACATDNKQSFEKWLKEEGVAKPEAEQMKLWGQCNTVFDCCIVKPFIFLQEVLDS